MTHTEQSLDELEAVLQALYPTIQKAAKSVAFQWPGVVESDDVQQMIALRLWESPGYLLKVEVLSALDQYKAVSGIGHQLASEERDSYDYFKGSYRYSVDEVKDLLKRGVLTEPVEGFDDEVFDLMEGLEALVVKTPQYVDAVTSRYADWVVPKSTKQKDALKNGLSALTNLMNHANKRRYAGAVS